MIKRILILFFTCLGLFSQAQEATPSSQPQMADLFRQDGKIYVVISVISIVFVFVIGLLIYIERKLKGLEKKVEEKIKH
ncbi:MAG: CcmD family protein [Bacteroidia bacterium]|nr:CcmD family protein [Bacteroidia bacterium]